LPRADTNVWPFLKETLPVWYLGRTWKGPSNYWPTVGPGELGAAVVIGATGDFVGLEAARSRSIGSPISTPRPAAAATGELDLRLSASQVAKSE
jgi:hypothetical protein